MRSAQALLRSLHSIERPTRYASALVAFACIPRWPFVFRLRVWASNVKKWRKDIPVLEYHFGQLARRVTTTQAGSGSQHQAGYSIQRYGNAQWSMTCMLAFCFAETINPTTGRSCAQRVKTLSWVLCTVESSCTRTESFSQQFSSGKCFRYEPSFWHTSSTSTRHQEPFFHFTLQTLETHHNKHELSRLTTSCGRHAPSIYCVCFRMFPYIYSYLLRISYI